MRQMPRKDEVYGKSLTKYKVTWQSMQKTYLRQSLGWTMLTMSQYMNYVTFTQITNKV